MNTKLFLPLFIALSLMACQNEQSSPATTPDEAISASTIVQEETTTTSPIASTVAVTKTDEPHHAQDFQANMANSESETKQLAKKVIAQLMTDSPVLKEATEIKPAESKKPIETVSHTATTTVAMPIVQPQPVVATGDANKGKALARKCMGCHNFSERRKMGPGLKSVMGRKAGAMTDMKYSAALAAGTWTWNEQNLATWLCDSKKAVKVLSANPKATTKMPAQRVCDTNKQADLIAFLKTL